MADYNTLGNTRRPGCTYDIKGIRIQDLRRNILQQLLFGFSAFHIFYTQDLFRLNMKHRRFPVKFTVRYNKLRFQYIHNQIQTLHRSVHIERYVNISAACHSHKGNDCLYGFIQENHYGNPLTALLSQHSPCPHFCLPE